MDAESPGDFGTAFPRRTSPTRHEPEYRALHTGLRGKHIAVVDTDAVLAGLVARACAEFGGWTTIWSDYGQIGALPGECHGLITGGPANALARLFSLADMQGGLSDRQIVVVRGLTGGAGGARMRWLARPIHEDYVLTALSAAMALDDAN